MKHIAEFFSSFLHPLLMPTYGIAILFFYSYLIVLPLSFKLVMVGGIFFFTALVPAVSIFLLYKLGKIKTVGLNHREDRPIPYLICLVTYACAVYFLFKLRVPVWVIGFTIGGFLSLVIDMGVNFKWKISAHMTGIGGVVGFVFAMAQIQQFFPIYLFATLILLAGCLGSSRILLGRHTLLQVVAGFFNGFLCVFLCSVLMTMIN